MARPMKCSVPRSGRKPASAKALQGDLRWSDAHFGYRIGHPREDLSFDRRNDAPGIPKCVVVDTAFSWGSDRPPRTPLADTRHPRGWYTAFGDIVPLVEATDDAVAIIGPGEEAHLEFTAPAPPPSGWTRRLVLQARGWCKDMDLYTKDGETVAPLPGRDTPRRQALHARFNTRYMAGY